MQLNFVHSGLTFIVNVSYTRHWNDKEERQGPYPRDMDGSSGIGYWLVFSVTETTLAIFSREAWTGEKQVCVFGDG